MCRKLLIYHPIAFGEDKVLHEGARRDYEAMTDVTGGAFVCFGGYILQRNSYGLLQSSGLYMQRFRFIVHVFKLSLSQFFQIF